MQPTTQSQNLKVCNSCKRTLHVSCFGITRKSKDGFNSCCKECRNYRRRKAYHQSSDNEAVILPLNENNRLILQEALSKSVKSEIPAIETSTNQRVTFKIDADYSGALLCEVFNGTTDAKNMYVSGASRDLFIEVLLYILRQRSIRLFPVDQPLLLLEWHSQNQSNPSDISIRDNFQN